MIILIIVYIVSVIGAVLSIRYDDGLFSSKPWTICLVFFPGINTGLSLIELFFLLAKLFDVIMCYNLDDKFYKLIRLGRK